MDYVFKTTTIKEWQKWLRQWSHKYEIEVLNCTVHDEERSTMLISRKEK